MIGPQENALPVLDGITQCLLQLKNSVREMELLSDLVWEISVKSHLLLIDYKVMQKTVAMDNVSIKEVIKYCADCQVRVESDWREVMERCDAVMATIPPPEE